MKDKEIRGSEVYAQARLTLRNAGLVERTKANLEMKVHVPYVDNAVQLKTDE